MKTKDLRALHNNELHGKLEELRKELMKARAQVAIGATPKNPGRVRAIKRSIARIMTISGHEHEKAIDKAPKMEGA
ncbi:50S ribosomal protein L29 [Candidatus Woesearchaeota archaeon]|nr:50S ribosomal protein L29 [Candidatus Woesearchaeota archaeon]